MPIDNPVKPTQIKPTLLQLIRLDNLASLCVVLAGIFALFFAVHALFDIQIFLGARSSRTDAEVYPIVMFVGLGISGGFLGFRLVQLNQLRQRAAVIFGSVVSVVHRPNGAIVVRYQYEVASELLEGKSELNRLHPFRSLRVGSGVKLLVDMERTQKSLIFDKI